MKATSAAKHSSVVSLLNEGYSLHDIQAKTGLGKSTVHRISKELDLEKENHPNGHPAKLTAHDKQRITHKISTEKLENAVQATQFINSIIPNPVHPQTVRNALKEAGYWSATKKKVPMLKLTHCQRWLKCAQYHENWTVEDWKRILWSDETKIN